MKIILSLLIILGAVIPLTVRSGESIYEEIYMDEDGIYRFKYTEQQMAEMAGQKAQQMAEQRAQQIAERTGHLGKKYGTKSNKKIANNTTRIASQLKLKALEQARSDEIIYRALIIHSESLKRNKTGVLNNVEHERLINEIKQINKEFEPFFFEELHNIKEATTME